MLTPRRIEIFRAIVNEFIEIAEPVGSKYLIEKYNWDYSSATVRNEMSALEELGLLEKTHVSSGRVPSTKGYRFYVEHLMDDKRDEQVENALATVFTGRQSNLDQALKESMELLSQMTNLTTAVLGPAADSQNMKSIRLVKIDELRSLVIFETDQEHSESRLFNINDDLSFEDLEYTVNLFNQRLQGTAMDEVIPKMEAIKPILAKSIKSYERLFEAFANTIIRFYTDNVVFSGRSNLLDQPEFASVDKVKQLISMLENSTLWHEVSKGKEGTATLQSSEHSKTVWYEELAIVTSNVHISDDIKDNRQLMIVGPSRMQYDKVVSLIDYITILIEEVYGNDEGED